MNRKGRADLDQAWCILRMSNRHTLGLADSLLKDGYEAWTPVETRTVRVPRANVKREVRLAMMPSFVFVRAASLIDMIQLAELPVKPRRGKGLRDPAHSDFRVMHCGDKIPLVPEVELANLRRIEARRTPAKRAEYSFPRNTRAKVKDGVFGGMDGIVIRSTPISTVLQLGRGIPVEISTLLLDPFELQCANTAARKAA